MTEYPLTEPLWSLIVGVQGILEGSYGGLGKRETSATKGLFTTADGAAHYLVKSIYRLWKPFSTDSTPK